jgi:aspartate racemase
MSEEEQRALLEQLLRQKASRPKTFPLSFAQERLWVLDQLTPGSPVYNVPVAVRLTAPLNVVVLERSLNEIVRRHGSLRTRFTAVDGQPVQVITPELSLTLPVVNLEEFSESEREEQARQLAAQEAHQPFDLARGPLWRASLLRLSDEEHLLLLTMHHIISDGWSIGVLLRELTALYAAYSQGQPSSLPALPFQYADYAVWQRQWLHGEVLEQQLSYWRQQLANLPVLELPTDRPRPAVKTYQGTRHYFKLPPSVNEALQALSRQEGVTLFMTLLAAFQTLLYRYTGQEDVVVGTPINGRTRAETEGLIGFFVNTLVVRTDLSGNPSFRELLSRVRQACLGAYAHPDVPFDKLVEELQSARDASRTPLFQVMFTVQSPAEQPTGGPSGKLSNLTLSPMKVERETAKFDLTLSLVNSQPSLTGWVVYNTDLFEAATIERLLAAFRTLLEGIVADPERRLSDLPLLTEAERRQLLVEWNETHQDYPKVTSVHQLIESQVERTPDHTAVVFEDQRLTYQEINEKANQLAFLLRDKGIGRGDYVPELMDNGPELLISHLAIMKAGAAFVPLDTRWPSERIQGILSDLNSKVVLVGQAKPHWPVLASGPCVVVDVPELTGAKSNPHVPVRLEDPIYVIFTSGSTGKPKGAINQHRGIVNRFLEMNDRYGGRDNDVILATSAPIFDASVWQLLWPLMNGSRTVIPAPTQGFDLQQIIDLMVKEQVTMTDFVPSVFRLLVDHLATHRELHGQLSSLRQLLIGGEAMSPPVVYQFKSYFPDVGITNTYGPTETSIGVIFYDVPPEYTNPIPIGRPIRNVQAFILDRTLNPVPVGVPGELYLGGACVGLGYVNDQTATDAGFIQNPFREINGSQLYKTGDLARFRPDGNIEFLGRLDDQMKIRGVRVQPSEIEAVLRQHPAVREAAVLAQEDTRGDKRLVAYVVPNKTPDQRSTKDLGTKDQKQSAEAGESAESLGSWVLGLGSFSSELRQHVKARLPQYMVPSAFVLLEALPLTAHGKLDRHALPAPDRDRPALEESFVAPRTSVEEVLVGIWADVLGLEQVGIRDNFFDLGGHSLMATQIMFRLREAFQVEIPLPTLFQKLTIEELALEIEELLLEEVEKLSDEEAQSLASGQAG